MERKFGSLFSGLTGSVSSWVQRTIPKTDFFVASFDNGCGM
jgi:hypothetical protein